MFFAKNRPTDCVAGGDVMVGVVVAERYFEHGGAEGGRVQAALTEHGDVLHGVLAERMAEGIRVLQVQR